MRTALLLFAVLLAPGCLSVDPVIGWDPAGENCASNTRPFIGDAQINSTYVAEEELWVLVMGFRWADPGESGAGDPGNMVGGEFTREVTGFVSDDISLTPLILETGCGGDPDPDVGTATYCSLLSLGNACPPGSADVCQAGGVAFPEYIMPAGPDDEVLEGDEIYVRMRARDACGMTSNTIAGPYTIGSGLMTGAN